MQKLYWNNDAFKDSTNFEHIKTHYYWSHITVSSVILSLSRWPYYLPVYNPDQPHEDCPLRTCSQHYATIKKFKIFGANRRTLEG